MTSIKSRVNSAVKLLIQAQGLTGEAYCDICTALFGDFEETSPSLEDEYVLSSTVHVLMHCISFGRRVAVQLQIAEDLDLSDDSWSKAYKVISRRLEQGTSHTGSQENIDLSQSIVPATTTAASPVKA